MNLSAARGAAGRAGLHELADGSLVLPERYADRYGRGEDNPPAEAKDSRTETERDRGRLGYSPALRRLAGVTQVVSPDLSAARRHSRESHTHKVALVSRELAELIIRRAQDDDDIAALIAEEGGLDIAACEAAGLAHDLGHAPFGHAGETELHNLLRDKTVDGFEGNPQSFRIVTRLEGRTFKRTNMALTNVTLCAILKYPWNREDAQEFPAETPKADEAQGTGSSGEGTPDPASESGDDTQSAAAEPAETAANPDEATPHAPEGTTGVRHIEKPEKYGAYLEDRGLYQVVRRRVMGKDFASNRRQSLEASVMDLADDIAYAIHDLEDFCSAGMIDLHEVLLGLDDAQTAVTDLTDEGRFKLSESQDPFTRATVKLRETYHGLFSDNEYFFALGRVVGLIKTILKLSSDDTIDVVLRDQLSEKIGDYFSALDIDTDLPYKRAGYIRLSKAHWHEVQVLKVITRHWLIQSPQMGVIQRAQTRAIRTLFDSLVDWLSTTSTEAASLPESLRYTLTEAGVDLNKEKFGPLDKRHYRAIGDYIGGLSDSEALLRSNWFAGRDVPGMTLVAEAY